MELSIKSITLIVSLLCTGLTAGLCFTWSNAITPGLGQLDDPSFLRSFQRINRVIKNPIFLIVFFSPAITLFANTYLNKHTDPEVFRLFLIAAIIFFLGVVLVTIFKNVPLNELLDKAPINDMSMTELKKLRVVFEKPWNSWHMVRTITSIIAFLLLLIGSIQQIQN